MTRFVTTTRTDGLDCRDYFVRGAEGVDRAPVVTARVVEAAGDAAAAEPAVDGAAWEVRPCDRFGCAERARR
ncbi:hypothetical protein, partial [Saccharomonospora halophila]|uniref:hypothetical protein n=1 Tax=Saccharomonospora halophila TaxID=129922 RepID=UPI001E3BBB1A